MLHDPSIPLDREKTQENRMSLVQWTDSQLPQVLCQKHIQGKTWIFHHLLFWSVSTKLQTNYNLISCMSNEQELAQHSQALIALP